MANIKSQIKRNKQAKVATARNKAARSSLKSLLVKLNEAIEQKDKNKATELYKETSRQLDKAATKGIIHLNRAATKKSSLGKKVNSLGK